MIDMMALSRHIDCAQEYFMNVAKNRGDEITLTFKNESPYVTVFLGKGAEAPMGMGDSVAAALSDAMGIKDPVQLLMDRINRDLGRDNDRKNVV